MAKHRTRYIPPKQTESILADSKIGISRKGGIEAQGLISYIVWITVVFLIVFFTIMFKDAILVKFFNIKQVIRRKKRK